MRLNSSLIALRRSGISKMTTRQRPSQRLGSRFFWARRFPRIIRAFRPAGVIRAYRIPFLSSNDTSPSFCSWVSLDRTLYPNCRANFRSRLSERRTSGAIRWTANAPTINIVPRIACWSAPNLRRRLASRSISPMRSIIIRGRVLNDYIRLCIKITKNKNNKGPPRQRDEPFVRAAVGGLP